MIETNLDMLGWQLDVPRACYFAMVLVSALATRFVASLLKGAEEFAGGQLYWSSVGRAFTGFCLFRRDATTANQNNDHFHPFWLGLAELSAFPILIALHAYAFVGAWIALKTIASAVRWKDERPTFNRFLIAQAAVLFLSLYLSSYVKPCQQVCERAKACTCENHNQNGTSYAPSTRRSAPCPSPTPSCGLDCPPDAS